MASSTSDRTSDTLSLPLEGKRQLAWTWKTRGVTQSHAGACNAPHLIKIHVCRLHPGTEASFPKNGTACGLLVGRSGSRIATTAHRLPGHCEMPVGPAPAGPGQPPLPLPPYTPLRSPQEGGAKGLRDGECTSSRMRCLGGGITAGSSAEGGVSVSVGVGVGRHNG